MIGLPQNCDDGGGTCSFNRIERQERNLLLKYKQMFANSGLVCYTVGRSCKERADGAPRRSLRERRAEPPHRGGSAARRRSRRVRGAVIFPLQKAGKGEECHVLLSAINGSQRD